MRLALSQRDAHCLLPSRSNAMQTQRRGSPGDIRIFYFQAAATQHRGSSTTRLCTGEYSPFTRIVPRAYFRSRDAERNTFCRRSMFCQQRGSGKRAMQHLIRGRNSTGLKMQAGSVYCAGWLLIIYQIITSRTKVEGCRF